MSTPTVSTPVRPSSDTKRGSMTPSYVWVKMAKNSTTSHQAELLEILPDGYLVRWTISNREQKISLESVLEQDVLGRRRTRGRNRGEPTPSLSSEEFHDDDEEDEEEEEESQGDNHDDDDKAEEEPAKENSKIPESLVVTTTSKDEEVVVVNNNNNNHKPAPPAKKTKKRSRGSNNDKKKGKRSKSKKKKQEEEEDDSSSAYFEDDNVNSNNQQLYAGQPAPPSPSLFVSLFQIHGIAKSTAVTRVAKLLQSEGYPDAAEFVTEFFLFAHERQSCWQRRNNDTNPQWSQSPILQNYNFANTYRALDRGTCYARYQFGEQYLALCKSQLLEQQQKKKKKNLQEVVTTTNTNSIAAAVAASIAEQEKDAENNGNNPQNKRPCTVLQKSVRRKDWIPKLLWASYCYRQVNQIEPFLNFGGIPDIPKSPEDLTPFLEHVNGIEQEEAGESETIFFAPSTTGTPSLLSYDDYRIHLQRLTVSSGWVLKKAAEELAKCRTLDACWGELLKRMPGMEACPDIAWQVLCDLLEAGCLQVAPDDPMFFCYMSPESLGILYASCWKDGREDQTRALDLMILLTEKQNDIFAALGVKFPAWNGRPLALKDLAHCLSQYSKYLQIQSDMRSRVHSPSHRLLVSRSYLDVSKTCRFCDKESDDGLFCDACLCYYCRGCEAESCEAAPEYWMCRPCLAMDKIHLTD